MNILLLGPQGSGKGTQARMLCDRFGFFYFESGAYLRKIAKEHPEIAEIMNSGKLVPDKEMTSYLTAFLDQEALYDDVIFDGFPRTLDQYTFLKVWLDEKKVRLDLAFVLEISEKESIRRLSARRTDPKTGEIYNLITKKPPKDVDENLLVQRDDDKPEAIKKRLEIYNNQTKKLLAAIGKDSKVIKIDGERPIDVIQKDLVEIIEKAKNG